jgi:hypothetical protein
MKTKNNKVSLEQTIELLGQLLCNVDEDCPHEYRSRHLEDTMSECHDFITKYKRETK